MIGPSTTMLRRGLVLVGICFAAVTATGIWLRDQPGGAGTRLVLWTAAHICEGLGSRAARISVGDGAHALDRAVLRRTLDMLEPSTRRCQPKVAGR